MARAYSQDLRDRVIETALGGVSVRQAAARYGVGADSDEAGRLFRGEAGHPFRFHSGQCSDLKPDTFLV